MANRLLRWALFSCLFISNAQALNIVSHKTAGLEYPENTLEGMVYSLTLPYVSAIEVDLHFTKDREIVLSHDPTLDDFNCGEDYSVNIAQTNYSDISELNCINQELKRAYKVPSIDPILRSLKVSKRSDIELNLEIKVLDDLISNWSRYQKFGIGNLHIDEMEMAKLIYAKLREHKIKSNIMFSTFSRPLLLELKRLKKADEEFRFALIYKGSYAPLRLWLVATLMGKECFDTCWWPDWENVKTWLTENEIDAFLPNWPQLSHFLFNRSYKNHFNKDNLPFKILPWTPNTAEDWSQLSEYTFSSVITDAPSKYYKWQNSN